MNPPISFSAQILEIEDIAHETKRFLLRSEHPDFRFEAGQFVLLQVAEKISRAYSIASVPQDLPCFELLIKYVEGGAATAGCLWKKQRGDTLQFLGPLGHFGRYDPAEHTGIFCVATGTGFAPIWALLQENFQRQVPLKTTFLFGVRSEEYLFLHEKLLALQKIHQGYFQFQICLSQPKTTGTFFSGRVTDALPQISLDTLGKEPVVFLCGGKPMVQELKVFLETKNILKTSIHQEAW